MPKFKVKDIRPNPYRNMEHYPIRPDKVEALCESLRATGFWGNVVARLGDDGKPQLAYGHHRWRAMQSVFSPDDAVSLIIQDLDEDAMIKIMARENMDEWSSNAMVEQETIKSVLQAASDGVITLPEVRRDMNNKDIRAVGAADGGVEYTTGTLAEYVGWYTPKGELHRKKVQSALATLSLVHDGIADEDDFEKMSTMAAQETVKAVNRILDDGEATAKAMEKSGNTTQAKAVRANSKTRAKEAVKVAVDHVADEGGARGIETAVMVAGFSSKRKEEEAFPDLDRHLFRVASRIGRLMQDSDRIISDFDKAVDHLSSANPEAIGKLVNELDWLIKRAEHMKSRLKNTKPTLLAIEGVAS